MKYYFEKIVTMPFGESISRVTEELKKEGFGVLTEINIHEKFKEKLDVDFRKYVILGACNPPFAHKALQKDNKIGTMLPCNVIVQELEDGRVEVAAVNPVASMMAVENEELADIADEVKNRLERVISRL